MKAIKLFFIISFSIFSLPLLSASLFYDDFQDGDISDWTINGAGGQAIANLYNNNYSLRLVNQKNATKIVSTSGYNNVLISAKIVAYRLESGESCTAEISADNGLNWHTIKTVINGQDDGVTWYAGSISPASANDNSSLWLRMIAVAGNNADYCYFDNVSVAGDAIVSGSATNIPFTDNFDSGWAGWTTDNGNASAGAGVSQETGAYVWSGNAVKFRGTANIQRQFSTLGLSDIQIDWYLLGGWLEVGESCDLQIDTGNGFTTIAILTDGEDDWYYRSGTVSLPTSANNKTSITVRLRGNPSNEYNTNDYDVCYTDEFSIYAITPEPEITISGDANFGALIVNNSLSKSITITNDGTADLNIASISGGNAQPFSITTDNCSNQAVAPSSSCNISIQFTPTTVSNFNDAISIPSNDTNEAISTVNLTGEGLADNSGNSDYDPLSGNGDVNRSLITYNTLMGSSFSMVNYGGFAVPVNASNPTNTFQGRLTLSGESTTGTLIEQGTNLKSSYTNPENLPEFDYDLVQVGTHIIPVNRGLTITSHPSWQYILEPGRVWNENSDQGFSRVALPFSLQESGANCTHNGVMTFLFKDDGSISNLAYQIAGETCQYFKYNSWGNLSANYSPSSISNSTTIINNYQTEVAVRMPTKPISALATDYPNSGINTALIGSDQSAEHTTLFGVAIDGTNYVGSCNSRQGEYPYCEVMGIPSYSASKSIFGAVGLMRLEKKYSGSQQQNIVTVCNDNSWNQITWGNLLDMATGRYTSSAFEADEGDSTTLNNFFLKYTHNEKLSHACSYSQISSPGSTWVYHTSDTYLLGTEMNTLEANTDIWDMLNTDIWQPLGLSPTITTTLRTNDSAAQPYTGYGLTLHRDDVVKIGEFLNKAEGSVNGIQVLDETMMNETLQKTSYHGLNAGSQYDSYDNGFWIWKADQALNCNYPLYIPYMSGFGGITIALLPNDMIFYTFSDNQEYSMLNTAKELNKVRNMCN